MNAEYHPHDRLLFTEGGTALLSVSDPMDSSGTSDALLNRRMSPPEPDSFTPTSDSTHLGSPYPYSDTTGSLGPAPQGPPPESQSIPLAGADPDAVVEHCPKCETLLDVTGCAPLTEAVCPTCGALIKVLREFHHFVLLSELGQGGSGTVYRAFDETLERDVALKLLRPEHFRDPALLESLEQEALLTASISHQHVVKVFSTGQKNQRYYIAMEIVNGGTLADRIARVGRMSEEETLGIAIQMAEALNAAYQSGLLHRDVKPGNILFVDNQRIKVADFGLATPIEHARNTTAEIWGTPDYIAPEKLLMRDEDLRSDLYSVGCTLFHCLTGRPPFSLKPIPKLIEERTRKAAPSVQTFAPEVTNFTGRMVAKLLATRPSDRFQTYGEFIEHLRYAQQELVNKSRNAQKPVTSSTSSSKRGKSASVKIAAALAPIVAVSTLALVYVVKHNGSANSRSGAASAGHVQNTPPAPVVGELNGSVALGTTNIYNLSQLGVIDWAHWYGKKFIHKENGGNQISDVTQIGDARPDQYGSYATKERNVAWTDGAPEKANIDDTGHLWCHFKENAGWSFTVPADTKPRVLNVLFGGAIGAHVMISAHLSDGSAQDVSYTQSIASGLLRVATFSYHASTNNQKLEIKLVKVGDSETPSVDIDAAWLDWDQSAK